MLSHTKNMGDVQQCLLALQLQSQDRAK